MSDDWVRVASFAAPLGAEMAMGLLQDEGIEVFSTGDLSNATFAGVASVGGTVELRVRAADEKLARVILAELEAPPAENWESEAEGSAVWVCSLCGEPVGEEQNRCPSCRTPRDAIRAVDPATTLRPRPAPLRAESQPKPQQITTEPPPPRIEELAAEHVEMPNLANFLADDLARRALRAAVFGAMTIFFLLNFYSLWLSLRLCLMPGELSPESSRQLRWAMMLNGFVLLVWIVAFETWRFML
jgi:hypothetical protein